MSNHSRQILRHLGIIFPLFPLWILLGCSPDAGNKVLAFFFDGVPPSGAMSASQPVPVQNADSITLAIASAPTAAIFYHKPYQERKCADCHDAGAMGTFQQSQPGLCYKCHQDFSEKFEHLHGPVDGGYCTQCHNPHLGGSDDLLLRRGQDVCLFCHEGSLDFNTGVHSGTNEKNCLDCHNPHGGNDKNLIR